MGQSHYIKKYQKYLETGATRWREGNSILLKYFTLLKKYFSVAPVNLFLRLQDSSMLKYSLLIFSVTIWKYTDPITFGVLDNSYMSPKGANGRIKDSL